MNRRRGKGESGGERTEDEKQKTEGRKDGGGEEAGVCKRECNVISIKKGAALTLRQLLSFVNIRDGLHHSTAHIVSAGIVVHFRSWPFFSLIVVNTIGKR